MNESQSIQRKGAAEFSPRGRGRRLKLAAYVFVPVIGIAIGGGLVYQHYADPETIRAIAETHLQRYTRGIVTVGSARLSLLEGIRLYDVAVSEVRSDTDSPGQVPISPVFECREVRLGCDLLSALAGDLKIESVTALEPTCRIVRHRADGRTNLTGLLASSGSPGTWPVRLPTLELRDAHIQVISREPAEDRIVENLRLTIRALPSKQNRHVYDVVWHGGTSRAASGHSQIDVRTGGLRNISGGLPLMSIEAVMLAVNARYDGAGAWCDLLGLDGEVRATNYGFDKVSALISPGSRDDREPATDGKGISATLELLDASISIPINDDERMLRPDERYLRFERVNGEVELTPDGIRAAFTGLFHGSECTVSATIHGSVARLATFDDLDDVDFDARISVKGLNLPQTESDSPAAEIRFINHWRRLAALYRDYDPHGPVDLEIEATNSAGSDEPIVRRVVLTARGGDASCRFFPYRVRNVEGSVEYTAQGVFLRELHGEHAGGTVSVNGRLAKATKWAAKMVTVKGTGLPIDEALWLGLPERYRRIREQFDPQGTFDALVEFTQPAGTEERPGKRRFKSRVSLRDVSASFVGFPYRVDSLTGTLLIDKGKLEVVDVAGRSGDARIAVDGSLRFDSERITALDLAVSGRSVPLDDALLSALPAGARDKVQAFHPSGSFDVETYVKLDGDAKGVLCTSDVVLHDVTIRHEKFPVEVVGITGRLHVTPEAITTSELAGRYNEAKVSVEGSVKTVIGGPSTVDLAVRTVDLRLDETLRSALPQPVREALGDWKIDGPIATETVCRTDSADVGGTRVMRTLARLTGATLSHPRLPIPFRNVRGQITFDAKGARGTGVEGRYGEAGVYLDFDVRRTQEGEEGTFTLGATGVALNDSLRDLLSEGMAATWDRLRPSGSIDLQVERLECRRVGADGPRTWSVEGYVELNDVGLAGVADIERMSGTLVGSGLVVDRLGGTTLSGTLALATVEVLGQRLTSTKSDWSGVRTADGAGMLVLGSIQGRIHDGSLTAKVEVAFDPERTDYNLSTTVHGMQIAPLIRSGRAPRAPDDEPAQVRGLADGHLYLSGVVGRPRQTRGRGRFEVLDAKIYRLPLILAIINVLQLSIPDGNAFDDARTDFFIIGNRVQFEEIVLRGSALALIGSGSMTLPECAVDLNLVSVSPHRWARVPVLTEFVEGASRELAELHVTGPLSQPKVSLIPLPGINREFKRLFRKKQPKNRLQTSNHE